MNLFPDFHPSDLVSTI